jgi:hypothetical protein
MTRIKLTTLEGEEKRRRCTRARKVLFLTKNIPHKIKSLLDKSLLKISSSLLAFKFLSMKVLHPTALTLLHTRFPFTC